MITITESTLRVLLDQAFERGISESNNRIAWETNYDTEKRIIEAKQKSSDELIGFSHRMSVK